MYKIPIAPSGSVRIGMLMSVLLAQENWGNWTLTLGPLHSQLYQVTDSGKKLYLDTLYNAFLRPRADFQLSPHPLVLGGWGCHTL